jgi:hypothetical protein
MLLAIQAGVARSLALPAQSISTYTLVFLPALLLCGIVWPRPRAYTAGLALILVGGIAWDRSTTRTEHIERDFFGVHAIERGSRGQFRALIHGSTIHGTQSLDVTNRRVPTSYYALSGPAGQVLTSRAAGLERNRVAVVGLGAGTLAAYAGPNDRWTFYEIDPTVERLARDRRYFTYLADCGPPCSVTIGDARLTLAAASNEGFDVIVLDAFSSDAIPVHLLTAEALDLYLRKLAPRGVILVHITNRFVDLDPVLARLAAGAGLVAARRTDASITRTEAAEGKMESVWAVMARSRDDLGDVTSEARWRDLQLTDGVPLWTDDFSNIVAVLKLRR